MPDFDIVTRRMCATNRYWKAFVYDANLDLEVVQFRHLPWADKRIIDYGFVCSCGGIEETPCEHIHRAKKFWCGWHEEYGGDGPSTDDDSSVVPATFQYPESHLDPCPLCGAPTEAVRVAV